MKKNILTILVVSLMAWIVVPQMANAQLGKSIYQRAKNAVNTKVQMEADHAVYDGLNAATDAIKGGVKDATTSSGKNAPTQAPNVGNQGTGTVDYYVNIKTGSNGNDGRTPTTPLKNIQKALDLADDNATILVAEGNYYGTLNKGNILISKPVAIFGGYNSTFTTRDILKHTTFIQPSAKSNGTAKGQGTMQVKVKKKGTLVVLDGLIFDRGNSIAYNAKGEGKPDGVDCPMMQPIGAAGIGGESLNEQNVHTTETAEIYFDNISCDMIIRNCAFLNAPNYGIMGSFGGASATISNNVFVNCRMATCQLVKGGIAKEASNVFFSYNTVLFTWSRMKDMQDMGYGYRCMPRLGHYLSNNIIGLSVYSGLDCTHADNDHIRRIEAVNNLFFLNKHEDIAIPGGGMYMEVNAADFVDVEEINKAVGNKSITNPSVFKGKINEAYLNGFLSASYKESSDYDPNSSLNTFRQAMGMNMVGTMESSATMFANRYPWQDALKLFGAMNNYGAQINF